MKILICLLIPFLGTTMGAFLVYFMKNNLSMKKEAILLSLSAGIMMAAAIWSLILPAIDTGDVASCILGFILGIIFLSCIKVKSDNKLSKMVLAITLHNIPEGMAVAVSILSYLIGNIGVSYISCLILSIGIAIQNLPEGAIISMPLRSSGMNKNKAFLYGVLSGVVEPLFGVVTIILSNTVVMFLSLLLGFAAGAMIYVVVEELIPDSHKYKYSTIFFAIGFLLMMILDVIFS